MNTSQLRLDMIAPERISGFANSAAEATKGVAVIATRLVLGYSFALTGLGKLRHFDNTVEFFTSLGIPFATANAGFVAGLELVGGVALMMGLGTRAFAALLSSTMVVALLTADGGTLVDAVLQRESVALTDVTPLVFLVFLLWLIGSGAGKLSADSFTGPWLVRMFDRTARARVG